MTLLESKILHPQVTEILLFISQFPITAVLTDLNMTDATDAIDDISMSFSAISTNMIGNDTDVVSYQ